MLGRGACMFRSRDPRPSTTAPCAGITTQKSLPSTLSQALDFPPNVQSDGL